MLKKDILNVLNCMVRQGQLDVNVLFSGKY